MNNASTPAATADRANRGCHFRSTSRDAGTRSWTLGGMGHIKANQDPEVTHFCQCGEVIDQSVVAKECATFGEHGGAGVSQLANDAGHFAGDMNCLLTFTASTGGGSGLEQVCLAAKKCWICRTSTASPAALQCSGRCTSVVTGSQASPIPLQFSQTGLDSRPAVRAET